MLFSFISTSGRMSGKHLSVKFSFLQLGGATGIEDEIFARLEAKARAQLDRLTFGRLKHETDVRENVKYCMVDLVNAIHADE